MKYRKSLMWFRRDLRFFDNVALSKACEASENVIPVFIFDTNILTHLESRKDKRVCFIYESLKEMEIELHKYNKELIVRIGDPLFEIPKIAKELCVDCVFSNKDYESYAINRDNQVRATLSVNGISFLSYKDQIIFEGSEILNQQTQAYKVFTPYKNAWLKKVREEDLQNYRFQIEKFLDRNMLKSFVKSWELKNFGFEESPLCLKAGREGALEKMKIFAKRIDGYALARDQFEEDETSHLSVHLRFGTVSIRELFRFANKHKSKGAEVWKSELIWREFFKMILCLFPHVEKTSFKKEYENLKWSNNEEHFDKWSIGMTGYPIVDAAMRHFNKTGWMHNRLRMVVASFLCKDLLIDYKKGEKYFSDKLLDFDLSSNNGGWQWCASTGCDAQPYFRVFNPESQSKKFSPHGGYIRRHCPELFNIEDAYIHAPHKASERVLLKAQCQLGKDYPLPIVRHEEQRLKAIKLFK